MQEQQNDKNISAVGNASATVGPIPSQQTVPSGSMVSKFGRTGLFFKVWIVPMIIIGILAGGFFVAKNIVFVDKSDYKKVDNLYKSVFKADVENSIDEQKPVEEQGSVDDQKPVVGEQGSTDEQKSTDRQEVKTETEPVEESKISR